MMAKGKPIDLTTTEYLKMKLTDGQIARMLGVSRRRFTEWKRDNGLANIRKTDKTTDLVKMFDPGREQRLIKQFKELLPKNYTWKAVAEEMDISLFELEQFRRKHFPETFRKPPMKFTPEQKVIAEKNGISVKVYRMRLESGWNEDKALNTPVKNKFFTKEQLELMKKMGISRKTVYARMVIGGLTFKQALTQRDLRSKKGKLK